MTGEAVKADTVTIGATSLTDIHGAPHVLDANGDGRGDLVIHVAVAAGELQGALTARTAEGGGIHAVRK